MEALYGISYIGHESNSPLHDFTYTVYPNSFHDTKNKA
jgi:hypothetical protein